MTTTPPPPDLPAERGQRGNPALGDIVRTVAVLAVVVLALFALARLLFFQPVEPARAVDYRAPLAQARKVAPFDVLAPARLPARWRATTVTYEPGPKGRWHLGVLTDDEDYVGLEQSPVAAATLLRRFSPDTRADGTAQIGGKTWMQRTSDDGETTYLRTLGDATVLITGRATPAQLRAYAASLTTGS